MPPERSELPPPNPSDLHSSGHEVQVQTAAADHDPAMSDPKQLGHLNSEPATSDQHVTQTHASLEDGGGGAGSGGSGSSGDNSGRGERDKVASPVTSTAPGATKSSDQPTVVDPSNNDSNDNNQNASAAISPEESGPAGNVQDKEADNVPDNVLDRGVDEPADDNSGPAEPMESSVATLKPSKSQFLSIKPPPYVDPTPSTPFGSQPPSRTNSTHRSEESGPAPSPTRSDTAYDERRFASDDEGDRSSRSEIDTIMGQFPEGGGGPGEDEVMSPRLEIASPLLSSPSLPHPPRKSSLEPLTPSIASQLQGLALTNPSSTSIASKDRSHDPDDLGPPVPPKDGPADGNSAGAESSSIQNVPLHRPPPPEPEPEPALPFDFHRFLEQLKHKKADPVARYLKSFLFEFGKRQWMVHEQVKIISDFLAFIANKMAQCEVWSDVSDAEFDNAREGMEKLVMNRLYTQTFSPAIPPPQPIPGAKPRRRGGERPMGPGRRGQHQEDVERDEVLAQRISIYGWVREEHLDIPAVGESGRRFLTLAQQGERATVYVKESGLQSTNANRTPENQVI